MQGWSPGQGGDISRVVTSQESQQGRSVGEFEPGGVVQHQRQVQSTSNCLLLQRGAPQQSRPGAWGKKYGDQLQILESFNFVSQLIANQKDYNLN